MKLVKIERDGASAEGVLEGDTVRIIGGWSQTPADVTPFTLSYRTVDELKGLLAQSKESLPLSDVTLAVPVNPLSQIICAGFNYHNHVTETHTETPANPVIFKRTLDTLVAHGQPVIKPKVSETFDYEGEIAVIIGRGGRHISEAEAMLHVSGYSCFMDGSVREYQKHAVTSGKNFWRTGAMGPWVVTADEIGAADLTLETFVAGEQRQSTVASNMIFSIAKLIAYCSIMTVLRPGDVIATGTPGGVGSRKTPPVWLKPGELVEVKVGLVGTLSNRVQEEA